VRNERQTSKGRQKKRDGPDASHRSIHAPGDVGVESKPVERGKKLVYGGKKAGEAESKFAKKRNPLNFLQSSAGDNQAGGGSRGREGKGKKNVTKKQRLNNKKNQGEEPSDRKSKNTPGQTLCKKFQQGRRSC